ncbi:Hypothetical predicted protein [Octopus vulgaris]|uniref:Uncharacterized protein n=2 Tax=Octopus TaxID=6643 RepID=A0AA36B0Q7_OCTVU|nr:uncharacterized protein LOC115213846 [Octopus sinensis]CAI9725204.1 Hypothetical predicted protein [Octopus vulgaris]
MQSEASRRHSEPAVCVSGGYWDVVPLYNAHLPGSVKLPKRFQRFVHQATSFRDLENMHISNVRCNGTNNESRLADLRQAIMWLRHELIDLRQHDVLLRRQFLNIQNTVESIKQSQGCIDTNGDMVEEEDDDDDDDDDDEDDEDDDEGMANGIDPPLYPSLIRNRSLIIRASAAQSTTNEEISQLEFRPRTSSTVTARDLAAKARRRDSKELCL